MGSGLDWVMDHDLPMATFSSCITLVIYCCATDYPQTGGLKQPTFIMSQVLWGRNLGAAYMGSSGSGCHMMLQIRAWPEIQKPEDSTGTKGSSSNLTYVVVGSLSSSLAVHSITVQCIHFSYGLHVVRRQGKAVTLPQEELLWLLEPSLPSDRVHVKLVQQ